MFFQNREKTTQYSRSSSLRLEQTPGWSQWASVSSREDLILIPPFPLPPTAGRISRFWALRGHIWRRGGFEAELNSTCSLSSRSGRCPAAKRPVWEAKRSRPRPQFNSSPDRSLPRQAITSFSSFYSLLSILYSLFSRPFDLTATLQPLPFRLAPPLRTCYNPCNFHTALQSKKCLVCVMRGYLHRPRMMPI